MHGRGWPKHRKRLIRLVTELFKASSVHGGGPELLGIFLNEVGNLSDLFDDTAKGKFEDMMREAFARATMDVPQVLWSPGETMAALRPDVPVECLSRLSHLPRVNSWREVERFTIHGATEHGTCKLLVYNNHQPASDDRPFPANMRMTFCKAIIINAIHFCKEDDKCCGFAFGGDGNCSLAQWSAAFEEVPGWNLTFQEPQFVWHQQERR